MDLWTIFTYTNYIIYIQYIYTYLWIYLYRQDPSHFHHHIHRYSAHIRCRCIAATPWHRCRAQRGAGQRPTVDKAHLGRDGVFTIKK